MFWSPQSGGAGRYAAELVPALLTTDPGLRITAFATRGRPRADWEGEVDWVTLPLEAGGGPAPAAAARLAFQWGAIPLSAARRRLELVHGLAGVVPPFAPHVATVVTVLDLIWMRDRASMGRRDTLAMKASVLPSVRRATRVLTISGAVKDDVVRTFGVPPERVDVTHLGVRSGATRAASPAAVVRAELGLGDARVVLCVAQKRSHKNLDGLLRAFAQVEAADVVLVLAGAHTPYEDELRGLAEELGVADRVRFAGWLDDAALEGLYALASAFVLPSFEEGFGLPVLEAMRHGVPVACSDASSLPEVAGGAAELFDPHDPAAIARALERLLTDDARRAELIARGRARCRELTWEATARATLEAYARALRDRRARD